MEELKLKDQVAAKYKMQGNHGVGEYHWGGHVVRLQHISPDHADRLVKQGFPYLELLPVTAALIEDPFPAIVETEVSAHPGAEAAPVSLEEKA